MKACVGVGEPSEALALPVPFTDVGRSCTHDTEAMGNRDSPTYHEAWPEAPNTAYIGALSPVIPGTAQPLWTLIILLPKGPRRSWAFAPVDCFSSQGLGWIPSGVSWGWRKADLSVHHFEAGEPMWESVQVVMPPRFALFLWILGLLDRMWGFR